MRRITFNTVFDFEWMPSDPFNEEIVAQLCQSKKRWSGDSENKTRMVKLSPIWTSARKHCHGSTFFQISDAGCLNVWTMPQCEAGCWFSMNFIESNQQKPVVHLVHWFPSRKWKKWEEVVFFHIWITYDCRGVFLFVASMLNMDQNLGLYPPRIRDFAAKLLDSEIINLIHYLY